MNGFSRWLFVFVMISFVIGCSGMVPLHEVDKSHFVDRSLPKDQVKEAIIEGAETAGWRAKDLGGDMILATYRIRTHMIHVEINYTDTYYATRYKSSNEMKMFCTQRDRDNARNIKVSGRQECPGGIPLYIHGNYKIWVDSLNAAIQSSLAFM
jgi:hypothetical protein